MPTLAGDLLAQHARAQRKAVHAIAPDALSLLGAYAWPGNVRELSNVLERAVILCSDDTITPIDLPVELGERTTAKLSPLAREEAPLDDDGANLERATLGFQRAHIARVLDAAEGSREVAARRLGLSQATFYRYLQKVGLKGYRAEEERHGPSPRGATSG